jgi:hypothetical protein
MKIPEIGEHSKTTKTAMANPRPLKLSNMALLQSLLQFSEISYFGGKSTKFLNRVALKNMALEPIGVGHCCTITNCFHSFFHLEIGSIYKMKNRKFSELKKSKIF